MIEYNNGAIGTKLKRERELGDKGKVKNKEIGNMT